MLKIRIIYDETTDNEKIPEADVIMCINCRKIIGLLLYNQKIENFITPVVTILCCSRILVYFGLFS